MNRLRLTTGFMMLAGAVALGVVWRGGTVQAEPVALGTANNFSMSEYYDSPHDTQMKSLTTGRQAQPQAGGRYLIQGLKLETYDEKGAREVVVEAPECIYDGVKRTASSSGHLRVVSQQGRFILEGDGFLWVQDASRLYISNRVHTIVHNDTFDLK